MVWDLRVSRSATEIERSVSNGVFYGGIKTHTTILMENGNWMDWMD
jgi:hypothetical protein